MHSLARDENPEGIYLNPRLRKKLAVSRSHPMLAFEAPLGYGKTAAARAYLRQTATLPIWTTVLSSNPEVFWRDFCRSLAKALPDQQSGIAQLKDLGYPDQTESADSARRLMLELRFPDKCALVVDDFHLLPVSPERKTVGIGGLFELLARQEDFAPRLILLTRNTYSGNRDLLLLKKLLAIVDRDDLALDESAVRDYCRFRGASLDKAGIAALFKQTVGWICAINLCLLHYQNHGAADIPPALPRLAKSEILDALQPEALDLLLALQPLERFSKSQAESVYRQSDALGTLRNLATVNSFLYFDESNACYQVHPVVQACLADLFASLPEQRRNSISAACAETALLQGDFMTALRLFHQAGQQERALETLEITAARQIVAADAIAILNAIFAACQPEILARHLPAVFFHAILAYLAGDSATLAQQLAWLTEYCLALPDGDPQTDARRGELEFILSLTAYNDIEAMSSRQRRAKALLAGRPVSLFNPDAAWTPGTPSIFYMFHRRAGGLSREVKLLREWLPHYYALVSASGSGGEYLMEGETLYHRGQFDQAEVAARRAEAQALAKNRPGNVLAVDFLLARLALMRGHFETAQERIARMRRRSSGGTALYAKAIDLCEAQLLAALGRSDGVAGWLRQELDSDNRIHATAGGYRYLVQGGVLLAEKRWAETIGIYSWLLESGLFPDHILILLYAHIYLAAANQALGDQAQAAEHIETAAELAFPDSLLMPFMENWQYIARPANSIQASDEQSARLLNRLAELAAVWEKRRLGMVVRHFPSEKPLLTVRELELARLAAQGLKYREIAARLRLAYATVKRAFATIYGKLGISTRQDLLAYLAQTDTKKKRQPAHSQE